jgi:hypothetical protein
MVTRVERERMKVPDVEVADGAAGRLKAWNGHRDRATLRWARRRPGPAPRERGAVLGGFSLVGKGFSAGFPAGSGTGSAVRGARDGSGGNGTVGAVADEGLSFI